MAKIAKKITRRSRYVDEGMEDQKIFLFEVHGLRCPNINRILSEQGNAVVVVPGSFKLVATVFIEQSSF